MRGDIYVIMRPVSKKPTKPRQEQEYPAAGWNIPDSGTFPLPGEESAAAQPANWMRATVTSLNPDNQPRRSENSRTEPSHITSRWPEPRRHRSSVWTQRAESSWRRRKDRGKLQPRMLKLATSCRCFPPNLSRRPGLLCPARLSANPARLQPAAVRHFHGAELRCFFTGNGLTSPHRHSEEKRSSSSGVDAELLI